MTSGCDFAWIVRSLLRDSGWGRAVNLEFHADESGTDAPELTVAGYLFDASRADDFCSEWEAVLNEFELPYFHMIECVNRIDKFEHLSKLETIQIEIKMIRLIKRYTINGFVCNIPNLNLSNRNFNYAEAIDKCLHLVAQWVEQTKFDGRITYFFEAGATGSGLADANMHTIAKDPARANRHRYADHRFVPKEGNPGVQAADLLAWLYHNFTKKRLGDEPARLDLRALLRHPHLMEDNCGELPRQNGVQSLGQSRNRVETVYYLPPVGEAVAKQGVILTNDKEGPIMTVESSAEIAAVLACSVCFRAIAEIFSRDQLRDMFFKCSCGTYCATQAVYPPYAS